MGKKKSIYVEEQMKTTFPTSILVWSKYSIITVLSFEEGTSKITMKKQEGLFTIWDWDFNLLMGTYYIVIINNIIDM